MNFDKFVDGKKLIDKAKEFATKCHKGQTRKFGGGEYINHPIAVAKLVEEHGGTPKMIAAAFLHDVVEDCDVSFKDLKKLFGNKVEQLVKELTNPKEFDKGDKKTEYMAKKMSIMSKKGLLIKLCDRLNNTSDFATSDKNWAKKYATKTRFILNALRDRGDLNSQHKTLIKKIEKNIEPYEEG